MSTQQLTAEVLALPLSERILVAQALWESIGAGLGDSDERTVIDEAVRRDQELSSGRAFGRTHDEVTKAARHTL